MSDLFVDVSVLDRLRGALGGAAEDLGDLGRQLARASARQLGSRSLDEAAEEFFERWRYGTEQLGEAADVVAQQVDEALRVYRAADGRLAEVFRSGP